MRIADRSPFLTVCVFALACGGSAPPDSSADNTATSGSEMVGAATDEADGTDERRREEVPPAHRPGSTSLPPFARDMVAAHDAARAAVSPAPRTPLPAMAWDPSLAALAQAWADRCPDQHRPDNDYGENMYFSSESSVDARHVVSGWTSEAAYYDYATGRCVRDRRADWAHCGHYTQVVWRDTTRVGCGVRTDCPGRFATVVVCNYDPPGNVNASATAIPRPY